MESVNKKSSKYYKDQLIDKKFVSKEIGVNKNPEDLYNKLKFQYDLTKILDKYPDRTECPTCSLKMKFYCTSCSKHILKHNEIPNVNLPMDIYIVKHLKEKREKSSAYPCIFLSDNFKLSEQPGKFAWSDIKELKITEQGHNYVLYPHKDARLIKDLPKEELKSIKSIKIVDCTWAQANSMMKKIPENVNFLKLEDYQTTFWRYQWHDDKCLVTVEAIYYLLKEFDEVYSKL